MKNPVAVFVVIVSFFILVFTTLGSIVMMSNPDFNIVESIAGIFVLVGSPIIVGGFAVWIISSLHQTNVALQQEQQWTYPQRGQW